MVLISALALACGVTHAAAWVLVHDTSRTRRPDSGTLFGACSERAQFRWAVPSNGHMFREKEFPGNDHKTMASVSGLG
jgi:hypothetical protein